MDEWDGLVEVVEEGESDNSDGLDEVDECDGPVDVVEVEDPQPLEALLGELGLIEDGQQIVLRASGRELGRMSVFIAGEPYVRCQCQTHPSCTLVFNTRANFSDKWLDCIRWLHSGSIGTHEDHTDAANTLKRKYGVRPRLGGSRKTT